MKELLAGSARLLAIAWRQHRGKTATAVILMLSGAAAAPATALALRLLTNEAVARHAVAAALAGVLVATLAIAALTFSHFAHIAYFELSELSVLELEQQLAVMVNGSPQLAHHERPEFADTLETVRQDIQQFRTALQALLSVAGLAIAMGLTALLLAQADPLLLLLLLLAVVPLLSGSRAERVMERAKLRTAGRTRMALSLFRLTTDPEHGKELRIFRLQEVLLSRHRTLWDAVTRRLWRAHLIATAWRVAGQAVFTVGYLGGVFLVVQDAIAHRAKVGDVILIIALAAQVNQQVAMGVTLLQDLYRMTGTMRRLGQIQEAVTPAPLSAPGNLPERLTSGIEFAGVSFAYPGTDEPVLRDVTLTLPAGTTVAVVGENGAGKSSLIKLLCGFYQPASGHIRIDGVDLATIPPEQWRERITAGFQDFARFEFRAEETVGLGDVPNMGSADAVMNALRRANATALLDRLPEGLRTQLGKSYAPGIELSGGQWQQLALGRAFMREQPLLLLLDEPTSAIDAQVEHKLFERYAEQAKRSAARNGAITILVSHRLSTVRMADLIIVLADGSIAEIGDHRALMQNAGLYSELYQLQAKAYRQPADPGAI